MGVTNAPSYLTGPQHIYRLQTLLKSFPCSPLRVSVDYWNSSMRFDGACVQVSYACYSVRLMRVDFSRRSRARNPCRSLVPSSRPASCSRFHRKE